MAGPWEDFQAPAAPAAPADGPWLDFQPKQSESVTSDVLKSAGSGLIRGIAALGGLPVDAINAFRKTQGAAPIETGSSEDLLKRAQPYLHEPQTPLGTAAGYAGEYGPLLLGGPETILAKLATRIGAPLAGGYAAGEVTKGTPYEDLARLAGGAAAGGLAIGRARSAASTRAASANEAAALEAKPLSEQGQAAADAVSKAIRRSKGTEAGIAREFGRIEDNKNLMAALPEEHQSAVSALAGLGQDRSETNVLTPLALGELIPGLGTPIMLQRMAREGMRNRAARRQANDLLNSIRRQDAGPTEPAPPAPVVRPGPTGPGIRGAPASPWARPAPAAPVPGTGFTTVGAPFNPAEYDAAAVARARQAPPAPTPATPPPSLGALVPRPNAGFTMRPGPIEGEVLPPQAQLPPAVQMALLAARRPALLPPPGSGPTINMPPLPIRAEGRSPLLALPGPSVPQDAATAVTGAAPKAAAPSAQARAVLAREGLAARIAAAHNAKVSPAPVQAAKTITKANGTVSRVAPKEAPPAPEPPAASASIPRAVKPLVLPESKPYNTDRLTPPGTGWRATAARLKAQLQAAPQVQQTGPVEMEGIPDFLRRTPAPPATPATPAQAPAEPAAPALAGLNGFQPRPTPFAGRTDHGAVAKESAAAWKARMEAEGQPSPSPAKLAAHEANVAAARPRIANLFSSLKAEGKDSEVLSEMREQMLHRPTYESASHRYAVRDHYLAQLSPAMQDKARKVLTNDALRGPRPASKDGKPRPSTRGERDKARQAKA